MKRTIIKILESWANTEGNVTTLTELLKWVDELKKRTYVEIKESSINESSFWFYDDYNGEILNRKRSFFSIKGIRCFENNQLVKEQPIIVQPEIGYLGIICKEIDGVMNFLMQAKIEPGNVNYVQISPTIQATKSNFTRAHGGKLPAYLEYFENASRYHVIYDQIQSEQASRFYKKRNRNMILEVYDEIPVYPNFKWMTLGQIKQLMQIDNLVNMDSRTVLSGIPLVTTHFTKEEMSYIETLFQNRAFFRSAFLASSSENLSSIYTYINNYKMFHDIKTVSIPLNQLIHWKIDEYGMSCEEPANFMIRYYDIGIQGREVQHWKQPLFKAIGQAMFGMIMCKKNGVTQYLIAVKPEIGSFDKVELGPGIQIEPIKEGKTEDPVQKLFRRNLEEKKGILLDVLLSEEGGRFYHEENRNVLMEIEEGELGELPEGYFWVNYNTLNYLMQINNCLNIQLRNLLSLLLL